MTSDFEVVEDKTYRIVFCVGIIALICLLAYSLYTNVQERGGLEKVFGLEGFKKKEGFKKECLTESKQIDLATKSDSKSLEEKALETLTANGKKLTDNKAVANKLKEEAELEEKLEQRKKQDVLFGEDKPAEKFDNCTTFSTADFENDYNKHIFTMSSDRINIPYITNQEDIDDRRGTISSLEDTQSNYNKYKDEENNCDIGNIEINKDVVIHTDKEQPPEPPVHKPPPLPPIEQPPERPSTKQPLIKSPQEDGEQRPVIPEFEVDYSDSSFPEIGYGMDYRKDTQYKLAQYKAAADNIYNINHS